MIKQNALELLIAKLKARFVHGSFGYNDPKASWRGVVDQEFSTTGKKKYGVYIIRQKSGTVLYIGRAGELDETGAFKNQDLPLRLKNTRESTINANRWFREFVEKFGPITVDYIVLNTKVTPESIEKKLLACHFVVFGCDPMQNKNRPQLNRLSLRKTTSRLIAKVSTQKRRPSVMKVNRTRALAKTKETPLMALNLTPQLESVIREEAERLGVTPELLALHALQDRFLPKKPEVVPQDEWERMLLGQRSTAAFQSRTRP